MVDVDPSWINVSAGAPAYDAQELRRTEAVLLSGAGTADRLGARQGVRPGAQAVTLAGTTVTVQDVPVVIYPGLTSISGPYRAALLSTAHALNPADGTNPRKDIIVCQVQDHDEDASGQRRARSFYVAGVPAATPVEPPLPAGSYRLATVDVPAGGTPAPSLTYNAPWVVASGGILPVRNDAELLGSAGGLYDGAMRWNQDMDRLEAHNGGSAWETVGSAKGSQVFLEEVHRVGVTWDPAAASRKGWRKALVEVQAGGGAGGGAALTGLSETSSGGGGQGGAYARRWITPADVPSPVTITIGAGGTGVTGGAGNIGGTSSFGTLVSAAGGAGGSAVGASGTSNCSAGGDSVQAVTGDIGIRGQGGGFGVKLGTSGAGGGHGGSSHLGGGGASRASSGAGLPGRQYGGGGGGGMNGASQSAAAGGDGFIGIVIVTLFV